jgi:CP family cyanate transporter-like MFS transporter
MLLADRFTGRKAPLIWAGVGCLAGVPLFLIGTPAAEVAGAAAIGLATAFALILTLALPPLLADPRGVHRLAGGMLAIGYLLAFILPLVGGVVWDATGSTASAFLPVVSGAAVLIAGAAMLRPHRPAEARRGESKALR